MHFFPFWYIRELSAVEISPDCTSIIGIALELQMDKVNSTLMGNLRSNCCSGFADTGLTCQNGAVIGVKWPLHFLQGTLSHTIALPKTVTWLDLTSNQISGTIPNNLPAGLRSLSLGDNLLTGSLPDQLPLSLIYLFVQKNKLTGAIPQLPTTLLDIYFGHPRWEGNRISGTVNGGAPTNLWLRGNLFTDVIISDASSLNSTNCDISNNPLKESAHLGNLIKCRQDGLYSKDDISKVAGSNQQSGLTGGEIAMIVLGSLILLLFVMLITYWCITKRRSLKRNDLNANWSDLSAVNTEPSFSGPPRLLSDLTGHESDYFYSRPKMPKHPK